MIILLYKSYKEVHQKLNPLICLWKRLVKFFSSFLLKCYQKQYCMRILFYHKSDQNSMCHQSQLHLLYSLLGQATNFYYIYHLKKQLINLNLLYECSSLSSFSHSHTPNSFTSPLLFFGLVTSGFIL